MKRKRTNPRRKPMTEADVKKMIKQASEQAKNELTIMSLGIALMVAHDQFGFGKKRLNIMFDDMIRKFDDLHEGLFTEQDINDWMWEAAGIRLEERTNKNGKE